MELSFALSNNTLIAGVTGAGKSYLLHRVIEEIIDSSNETASIYIGDPKHCEFNKLFKKRALKYSEIEVFKIFKDRLSKLENNENVVFNDVYVIFDELAEALFPRHNLLEDRSNKNRKFNNRFIELFTSDISKKIKMYIICATQLPNLLLPSEIQSKFNWYIDVSYGLEIDIDEEYSSELIKDLGGDFTKFCTANLNKRCLTIYKIRNEDK